MVKSSKKFKAGVKKVKDGLRWFKKQHGGSTNARTFKKTQEGSRRFKAEQQDSRRIQEFLEGSNRQYSRKSMKFQTCSIQEEFKGSRRFIRGEEDLRRLQEAQ